LALHTSATQAPDYGFLWGSIHALQSSVALERNHSRTMPLSVGATAPEFELPAVTGTDRSTFKLADYRGKKNIVLAFYALDWSPT
jgi:hypothetical protein